MAMLPRSPCRCGSDNAVIGALNIYAAEPDAFDEDVVELLSESADDLAFGIAALRDEVEQKRTQAALHTAEEHFRAVAEASLDALFILRSVRGEHGEILDFEFTDLNPRAEQMLDMARDKVVGQKLCELLPVNRSGGFFDKYVAVVTTGTPLEEEFPIDVPEIKAKWLRHQVVRVGDGIAISSRDITEWKMASAEITAAGQAQDHDSESGGRGYFRSGHRREHHLHQSGRPQDAAKNRRRADRKIHTPPASSHANGRDAVSGQGMPHPCRLP